MKSHSETVAETCHREKRKQLYEELRNCVWLNMDYDKSAVARSAGLGMCEGIGASRSKRKKE